VRVTLASGQWVDLVDPVDLTVAERESGLKAWEELICQSAFGDATWALSALLAALATEWSFSSPLPTSASGRVSLAALPARIVDELVAKLRDAGPDYYRQVRFYSGTSRGADSRSFPRLSGQSQ
jgi:hypothetical protein